MTCPAGAQGTLATGPSAPDGLATRLLTVQDLSVTYEDAAVATPDGVCLEVRPGEVVLLLGPSGCGKTTLSLAANGLIPQAVPASLTGSVTVGGLSTVDHPVARLSPRVAMVFQDPDAQMVTASLLDEVCFGPENLMVPVEEVLARAEDALRLVGLWERRDHSPDVLSGGGRQRLAIACAVAMRSPLIVLDEPTANLDPTGVEEVYAALGEIVSQGRHGILLVEHNLDACMTLVSRVVVLDAAGHVALEGTVDEVVRQRCDQVARLGVWLPVATTVAQRLRRSGVALDPVPVTTTELAAVLDAQAGLPAPLAAPAPEPLATGPVKAHSEQRERDDAPQEAVTARHLSVRRGGRDILHDVSLTVRRGVFLALVGANGAGKTTLLRSLAGIDRSRRDTVRVMGADPGRLRPPELARTVGYVFQNPEHQFVTETVRDELAHGLVTQQVPQEEVRLRVEEMLERFDLAPLATRDPFMLSGGQKRRLSVAAALITGAQVLFLDEPTYGQDRERAAALIDLLLGLNADGVTVVMASHDLQVVCDHSQEVAVLRSGRLVAHGPTEDVVAGGALQAAGLRRPPLAQATGALRRHPQWHGVVRMGQVPAGPVPGALDGSGAPGSAAGYVAQSGVAQSGGPG